MSTIYIVDTIFRMCIVDMDHCEETNTQGVPAPSWVADKGKMEKEEEERRRSRRRRTTCPLLLCVSEHE